MTHPRSGTRDILTRDVIEVVYKAIAEQCFISVLSQTQLANVKSEYNCSAANISLVQYDKACNGLKKNIAIGDIPQTVLAHNLFGLEKAKRFSTVPNESPDKEYWFAKFLLSHHLKTRKIGIHLGNSSLYNTLK